VATRKLRYVIRGTRILVTGRVKPFVAGQKVTVELRRRRKTVARKRVKVKKGGKFSARLKARRRGVFKVRVKHAATKQQVAFTAKGARVKVVVWKAGRGAHGTKVLLLQRALRSLGFAVPVAGFYNGGTSRAVLAFRKVNGMSRTEGANRQVFEKVFAGRGGFRLRYPSAGKHVEFDWSRQVLVLADHGRPVQTYTVSSGKPSTPTIQGAFKFYMRQPGTNSHGMVWSTYFHGGYAVHGYASVPPNYPASHGCVRTPMWFAPGFYARWGLGTTVYVFP
jgi:lipoprotein-anchoring transpeptidase ErfK/SrfK